MHEDAERLARAFHERLSARAVEVDEELDDAQPWDKIDPELRGLLARACDDLLQDGIVEVLTEPAAICTCGWSGPASEADAHEATCVGAGELPSEGDR